MTRSQKNKIDVRDYTLIVGIGDAINSEPNQRQSAQDIEREILAAERRKLFKWSTK